MNSLLQLLDQQLAAADFHSRICLVSLNIDHGDDNDHDHDDAQPVGGVDGSSSLEDEVSNYRLWPALKFDSHKELMQLVAKITIPDHQLGGVKSHLTVEYFRLCKSKRRKESYGVAYLLGRKGERLVLLSANEGGEIITDNTQVFDFYERCVEMNLGKGPHCGSEEFQAAFQLALTRFEHETGENEYSSGAKNDNKEEKTRVEVEGVTSNKKTPTRKTFSNVEYTPLRSEIEKAKNSCQRKQSENESTEPTRKTASPPTKDPKMKETGSAHSLDGVESEQLPVKTVVFSQNGTSGSVSSPEKPFSGEDSVNHSPPIARRKNHRCSLAKESEMPWIEMYTQMKADGWTHMSGTGLTPWFYVHPTCKGMKKNELIRTKEAGVDYFTSEEDLMRYARLNLGWSGSVESVSDSPRDAEMADRIKKRKRGLNVQQNNMKQVEVKPKVQNKKNPTKEPTGAKKQQVQIPKRTMAPDSPESSRFSADSISHRTRSNEVDPTGGDPEADIGVQMASGKKDSNQKVLQFRTQNDISNGSSVESESELDSGLNSTSDTSEQSPNSSDCDSDSEQSSEDEMYQIISGSSAWRLLQERFGFTYHSVKYCLPGKKNRPGKDSTAEEGVNYFGSLDDIRKHLCAYGLPEIKKHLTGAEVCDLSRWIRYANVTGLSEGALINPKDIGKPLTFINAWCMLQKLGMKYSSGYVYPTSDLSKPLKFERPQELIVHLARFGIPHIDGIHPSKVLDEDDRFKLDLFIADADRDCFERVNPNSGLVNEITPRRTRSGRANESELGKPAEIHKASQHSSNKRALNPRAYQNEFNQLAKQRKFPLRLLSSQMALETLIDCYSIHVLNRGGKDYYCLPHVSLAEDEDSMLDRDYFEHIQSMRENLCAYGLPPLAKGSKISAAKLKDLESWVRLANVSALRNEQTANIPQDIDVRSKGARKILKGLKYTFSDKTQTYLLPGISAHKSRLGQNRFNFFIDLVNHVARFGLDDSKVLGTDNLPFSEMQRLELEVFMASVATFDVGKRVLSLSPMRNKQVVGTTETTSSSLPAATLDTTKVTVSKVDLAATPSLPAVVDDECDQDSPHLVPPKKAKTTSITQYFQNVVQKVGEVVASTFSPSHRLRSNSLAHDDQQLPKSNLSISSSLNRMSPSCIDTKGDDEIEACFAETPDRSISFEPASCPDHGVETPKSHVENDVVSTGQEVNIDVEHYPQAASPSMPWTELWHQMRKSGWKYSSGNDLVAWFWIHPSVASMKKSDMIRRCTEGIHYFSSEDDVRQYATKHLGWSGGGTSHELSPGASILSMTARVKKRNQGNTLKSDSSSSKRARASSEQRYESGLSPKLKLRSSPRTKNEECEESTFLSEDEYKAPPDLQPTVRDKLEYCQMVLHPSFKKNELSKSSSLSVVSSMESDIKDFMTKSIETGLSVNGMTSPSPGFLYVCGGPGTGKTTAVTSCADEMNKWAKQNGYDKPSFCFVNMASSQTASTGKGGIVRAVLQKMAVSLNIDKDADISVFENLFKRRVVVLMLDEIDMLFKRHGGVGETCLRTLIDWAENKDLKFSLIGISNCVNDASATRVRELGHSPRELVFSTYKEHDILAILEQRLGKYVVDHKALQLISRRVAASTGDARRALEITSNAVGKCEESLTDAELDREVKYDDECMPLVKLPHMMRAIREGMPMRHVDIISGLPQAAKVILCIAVTLSHIWGPTAKISISTLKKFCVEASRHSVMDDLGLGHIMNLVEMLIDSGLLITCNSGRFNPYDSDPMLRLGVQLDDVEIALEESLFKIGFYQGLVGYIKRECPHPDSP